MQSDEHAKTPWKLGGCSGRMVEPAGFYGGDGFVADVDTKANARRIVASVNALAKLPIEDIEKLKPEEVRRALGVKLVPISERAD